MTSVQDRITHAKNFQVKKVTYKPPVAVGNIRRIYLQYKGDTINMQTPLIKTWGLNERVDDNSGKVSYDISLQFGGENPSILKFKKIIKELEDRILQDAVKNSKQWFGRKMSEEVAKAMFYPLLKHPKLKDGSGEPDFDREPTFKVKIQYYDEKFRVDLFDTKGEPLFIYSKEDRDDLPQGDKTPVDFIPKGSYMKSIIECQGIWFAGGRFGVTWKLNQASIRPPNNIVGTGKCHLVADSDDEEGEKKLQKQDELNTIKQSNLVIDSDDDDDDDNNDDEGEDDGEDGGEDNEVVEAKKPEPEPELEAEPEEKPKKKKRTIRRKKKHSV